MAKLILMTFPLFVYFMEVLVDHNLGNKESVEGTDLVTAVVGLFDV